MRSSELSSAAAIAWCTTPGSSPSTTIGSYPYPRSKASRSSAGMRASSVGFAILYWFRWRIGSTAPSRAGFRNRGACQLVASAPVSASPSPTTQRATSSGSSSTAPHAWRSEYPSSPPSWNEPGVSGAQWLGTPPGNENCRKKAVNPWTSRSMCAYSSEYVPSSHAQAFGPGPPWPGPATNTACRSRALMTRLACAHTRLSPGTVPKWPSNRGFTCSGRSGSVRSGFAIR